MFQDSSENEVIRLELVLAKEQEARRALTLSMEETGGRLGHDYQAGGSGRVGFDNSLDISQIEREAAEGQEVDHKTQNHFEHCPPTSIRFHYQWLIIVFHPDRADHTKSALGFVSYFPTSS